MDRRRGACRARRRAPRGVAERAVESRIPPLADDVRCGRARWPREPVRRDGGRSCRRCRVAGQYLLAAGRLPVRSRPCDSHPRAARATTRVARRPRADRLTGMDFERILSDGIRAGLGMNAAVYALAAVGLNVQFGYTGLWNFGQAGFLLVGGYGTAIAVSSWGLWLPWAVLIGIAASILLGLVLGIPTLRLRGDYLAIVTIAAAEILRIVVNSTKVQSLTGGPQGIGGFANWFFDRNPISPGRYGFGTITYDQRQMWVTLVTWALVA